MDTTTTIIAQISQHPQFRVLTYHTLNMRPDRKEKIAQAEKAIVDDLKCTREEITAAIELHG